MTGRKRSLLILMHWTIALLAVLALASGFMADEAGAEAVGLLKVHLVLGGLAGALSLIRIVFWLWGGSVAKGGLAARLVHGVLAIVPVGMAASGIGMFVLSGAAAVLLGTQPVLPDFETLPPRIAHGLGAIAFLILIALHTAAALYHQFVMKDGTLGRMGFRMRT